ncbi:MAG: hypothetical protein ACOVKC_09585, partial [Brevundimonas sp.]
KERFFAVIGSMDVHPHPVVSSFKGRHFKSIWKTPGGSVLGESQSDSWGSDLTQFWLRTDLA